MNEIANLISTVGFPIASCVGLGIFVKYVIDENNRRMDKIFEMYNQQNLDNRQAINACTEAIEKLCDKIDDIAR